MAIEQGTPMLGEFGPRPLLGEGPEDVDGVGDWANEAETQYQNLESSEDIATYKRRVAEAIAEDCDKLRDSVWAFIEDFINKSTSVRDSNRVIQRWNVEEREYRLFNKPVIDETGSIVAGRDYSHLKTGMSLGLFNKNVLVLGPKLSNGLMGTTGLPFILESRSSGDETTVKDAIINRIVKNGLDKANWASEIRNTINDTLVLHGFMAMRQTWVNRVGIVKNHEGLYEERVVEEGYQIRPWNPLDVWLSHASASTKAVDQRTVVWRSKATLNELLGNRRVWITGQKVPRVDGGGLMVIPLAILGGRFTGLEAMIRDEAEAGRRGTSGAVESKGESSLLSPNPASGEIDNPTTITAGKVYEVYELQGEFPAGMLLRAGKITEAALAYHDVSVRTRSGELSGEALARFLDRVYIYATIARDQDSGKEYIIEFKLCPYPENTTELVWAHEFDNGKCAYGYSALALCNDVWAMCDKIVNDALVVSDFNSSIKPIGDSTTFDDRRRSLDLYLSGRTSITTPGSPREAIHIPQRPHDVNAVELLRMLMDESNTRGMASSVDAGSKATTQTGTLGEIQSQASGMENRELAMLSRLAEQLIEPCVNFYVMCLQHFLEPDELADLAMREAGTMGIDAEYVFPAAADRFGNSERLVDEYQVRWVPNADIEKQNRIKRLLEITASMASIVPSMKMDIIAKDAYDMAGFKGDRYVKTETVGRTSIDRFKMILHGGDMPEPSGLDEDIETNIMLDEAMVRGLMQKKVEAQQAGLSTEFLDDAIRKVRRLLELDRGRRITQMEMEARQMQEAVAAEAMRNAGQGQPERPKMA